MIHRKAQSVPGEFLALMERVKKVLSSKIVLSAEDGITPLQLFVLGFVLRHGGVSAQELGSHVGVSTSSIAQLTRRMIKADLLLRKIDRADRRVVRFYLTQKGKKKFHRFHRDHMERMRKVLRLVPEKDVRDLVCIFSKLLEKIQKHGAFT